MSPDESKRGYGTAKKVFPGNTFAGGNGEYGKLCISLLGEEEG